MERWTSRFVIEQLREWTTTNSFWQLMFAWCDEELDDAIERANATMSRADLKPSENMCFIRIDRTTKKPTAGALKRLNVEADLLARSHSIDGLLLLPHERDETAPPTWFKPHMTYSGRERNVQYDYPTITQKFCEFARGKQKASPPGIGAHAKTKESDEAPSTSDQQSQNSLLPDTPSKRKRDLSALNGSVVDTSIELDGISDEQGTKRRKFNDDAEIARPPLGEVEVHVGWLNVRDGIMILEKGFRSLRTWLESTIPWRYDFAAMKQSLQISTDSGLRVFWFEDHSKRAWEAQSDHDIAGAMERMHRKGEICLFVSAAAEHVHAVPVEHRLIQHQTDQIITFDLRAMEHSQWDPQASLDDLGADTDTCRPHYEIPGITVSLARILGELKMRSRVTSEDLEPQE